MKKSDRRKAVTRAKLVVKVSRKSYIRRQDTHLCQSGCESCGGQTDCEATPARK